MSFYVEEFPDGEHETEGDRVAEEILLSEESKPDVEIEQPEVVEAQAKPSRKEKANSLIGAIKKKQLQH